LETEMSTTTFGVVTTLLLHIKQCYIVPHTLVIVVVYPQVCTNTNFYHCTPSHFHKNSSNVSRLLKTEIDAFRQRIKQFHRNRQMVTTVRTD